MSPHRRWILLTSALTVIAAALALQPYGSEPVHAGAALALIFVLPGAPAALTVLPRASWLERAAVTVVASIAVTALVSLSLHVLGVALDSNSWILAQLAATLVMCTASISADPLSPLPRGEPAPRQGLRGRDLPWSAVTVLALASAGWVTVSSNRDQNESHPFTQFWETSRTASSSVVNGHTLAFGIKNQTGTSQEYQLRVRVAGEKISPIEWIDLASGETTTRSVTVGKKEAFVRARLKALRVDDPDIRTLSFHTR